MCNPCALQVADARAEDPAVRIYLAACKSDLVQRHNHVRPKILQLKSKLPFEDRIAGGCSTPVPDFAAPNSGGLLLLHCQLPTANCTLPQPSTSSPRRCRT